MRHRHLILATVVCALLSTILSAQEVVPPETSPGASENPAQNPTQNPVSSTNTTAHAQPLAVRTRGRHFYVSAQRHPLIPRDVSMREAVESLGIDKHRFVRCELKDGSHLIGGITSIHSQQFTISKGIMGVRPIGYSDLKQPPQPVPAVGEHFVNGLNWTGLVATCVVLSPLLIVFVPLIAAGVISD
jgi:hypothetical protein